MGPGTELDLEYFERSPIVHVVTTNHHGLEVVTPIWAVVVDGHAYVRNGHGPQCKWFQRVLRAHAAEFVDGDRRIPATAEPVMDPHTLDHVDEAYRAKYTYPDSPIEVLVGAAARGDTLRISPQPPRHPATGSLEHA